MRMRAVFLDDGQSASPLIADHRTLSAVLRDCDDRFHSLSAADDPRPFAVAHRAGRDGRRHLRASARRKRRARRRARHDREHRLAPSPYRSDRALQAASGSRDDGGGEPRGARARDPAREDVGRGARHDRGQRDEGGALARRLCAHRMRVRRGRDRDGRGLAARSAGHDAGARHRADPDPVGQPRHRARAEEVDEERASARCDRDRASGPRGRAISA